MPRRSSRQRSRRSTRSSGRCPPGQIMRRGYRRHSFTRKNGSRVRGSRVSSSCIEAIGSSRRSGKRSERDIAYLGRRASIHRKMSRKYGSRRCPSGEILREGFTRRAFTRKDGTRVAASEVPPACVKDTGLPGKGFKIPTQLQKGELKKFGYEHVYEMSESQRHNALRQAERAYGSLPLFRKLIVLGTMFRNKDPELSDMYRDDAYWVRNTFGVKDSSSRKGSNRSRKTSRRRSRSRTSTRSSSRRR